LFTEVARAEIKEFFTAYDMKRLHAYAQELVDYHLITDLLPALARFYFLDRFGSAKVAPTQAQILIAMGLQYKTIEETSKEMSIPVNQALALFNKSIRRISRFIRGMQEEEAEEELDAKQDTEMTNGEEQSEEQEATQKQARDSMLESLKLGAYSIKGTSEEWKKALKGKTNLSSVTLSTTKQEPTNADKGKDNKTKRPSKVKGTQKHKKIKH